MLFWLMQGELEGQARHVYADGIRKQPEVDPAWTPAVGIAEVPVLFNRKLLVTSVALLMAAAVTSMDEAVQSWQEYPLPLAKSGTSSSWTTGTTNVRTTT